MNYLEFRVEGCKKSGGSTVVLLKMYVGGKRRL